MLPSNVAFTALLAALFFYAGLFSGAAAQNRPFSYRLSPEQRAKVGEVAQKHLAASDELENTKYYLVGVEKLLGKGKNARPLARATFYIYRGDLTKFVLVELQTFKVIEVQTREHIPTRLSQKEMQIARGLALKDPTVRKQVEHLIGAGLVIEVLLLHTQDPESPYFRHRAVSLLFRVGRRYVSTLEAIVNLTTEKVNSRIVEPSKKDRGEAGRPGGEEGNADATSKPPDNGSPSGADVPSDDSLHHCSDHIVTHKFVGQSGYFTAWEVHWAHAVHKGLIITGAWFQPGPHRPKMKILGEARCAEIFVPYHPGEPRYYDLTGVHSVLLPLGLEDAGPHGALLSDGNNNVAVKEIRDRGVVWKDDFKVRRGHELVLWGAVNAGNYNYLIQYRFRDDGSVAFEIGSTGQNRPTTPHLAHMHTGFWRIDIDLNGEDHDAVFLAKHKETPSSHSSSHGSGWENDAQDSLTVFNCGKEGYADWNHERFTVLHVEDTVSKNAHGRNIGYDLIAIRRGSSRHAEAFSHHDFWVTQAKIDEDNYALLPTYMNDESIRDTDVVLWHATPVHHKPRDEDGEFIGDVWNGAALVMWSGCELRPRNLFDHTPFHD